MLILAAYHGHPETVEMLLEHGADPKNTPPHAWYVAFAPAENPQVAIAVVVENGGDQSLEATGGSRAAPIGRAVIAAALQGGR